MERKDRENISQSLKYVPCGIIALYYVTWKIEE